MTSFIWKQKQQQVNDIIYMETKTTTKRFPYIVCNNAILIKIEAKKKNGPVAWYLALKVCVSVAGSSSIRVTWDFLGLAGSYPGLGVLWAQWGGGTTQPSFIHLAAESLRALL